MCYLLGTGGTGVLIHVVQSGSISWLRIRGKALEFSGELMGRGLSASENVSGSLSGRRDWNYPWNGRDSILDLKRLMMPY